jgi:L-fuconolactonase
MTGSSRAASPLLDTHFHLWKRDEIVPAGIMHAPYLSRDFEWKDYEAATQGLGIGRAIHVQVQHEADKAAREVAAVKRVMREHPSLVGMVAWAPLEDPDVERHLVALVEGGDVLGVRRLTQNERDPLFCARRDFIAGTRLLASYALVCEICVLEHQLEGVVRLANACPDVTIVLDHLGKPRYLSRAPTSSWLLQMRLIGSCENVVCKVAPTLYDLEDPELTADDAKLFVRHAVETFGWDRVVFGTNWPPSQAIVACTEWPTMLRTILADATQAELDLLFQGNASRIFALDNLDGPSD